MAEISMNRFRGRETLCIKCGHISYPGEPRCEHDKVITDEHDETMDCDCKVHVVLKENGTGQCTLTGRCAEHSAPAFNPPYSMGVGTVTVFLLGFVTGAALMFSWIRWTIRFAKRTGRLETKTL